MNTVNYGKFTGCMPNKVRGGGLLYTGVGEANLHFTPDLCTGPDTSDHHQVVLVAQ